MRGAEARPSLLLESVAEMIGTFILVFAGTAVACAAALALPIAGGTFNSLAVGLTFGLVLAALVAALGHVSGTHLNPAVTVGLATIRQFPWACVPAYVAAQFAGAILAALAVWGTFGDRARSVAFLGATYPTPGVGIGQAFLMEFLITFVLVFVVVSVGTDRRAQVAAASLAIGLALAVGVLIGGPITGGAVNPARAIGPMIVAAKFTAWWIYLVAPLAGGILASVMYDALFRKVSPPEPVLRITQEPGPHPT